MRSVSYARHPRRCDIRQIIFNSAERGVQVISKDVLLDGVIASTTDDRLVSSLTVGGINSALQLVES